MNSFKCPECNLVNWATEEACKRCGVRFAHAAEAPSEASYTEGGYQTPGAQASWQGTSQDAQYSSHYDAGLTYETGDGARSNSYYAGPEMKKRTGMAVTSLVLGIIGFFTFGVLGIGACVGMVLGIVALNKSKKFPAQYGGEGLAIGGIITNILALLSVAPLAIILAITIPNLLASRRAANEANAISVLKRLAVAEDVYQSTFGAGTYATVEELSANHLLDSQMAATMRRSYQFDIRVQKNSAERASSYEVIARPMHYGEAGSTGTRSFYLSSEDGEIHAARGMEVDGSDPVLRSTTTGEGLYPTTRRDKADWSN